MERCVFTLNGEVIEESDSTKLHLSAAEYIRQYQAVKSIKVSCSEGGCGACAVELIYINGATGQQSVLAVNSCLMPVAALHGCHVITSEGLGNSRQGFNEVHRRLAGFHGTQCGFCSPGVSVSCHAAVMAAAQRAHEGAAAAPPPAAAAAAAAAPAEVTGCPTSTGHRQQHECNAGCNGAEEAVCGKDVNTTCNGSGTTAAAAAGPTAAELLGALDGNICRCTGWRPIADMAKSFACDVDIEDLGLSSLCKQQLGPVTDQQLLPACLRQQPLLQLQQQQQRPQQQFYAALQAIKPGCVLVPQSLQQLLAAVKAAAAAGVPVHLLAGNTGAGIYHQQWQSLAAAACVVVKHVPELCTLQQVTYDQAVAGAPQTQVRPTHTSNNNSSNNSSNNNSNNSSNNNNGSAVALVAGAGVTISQLNNLLQHLAKAEAAKGTAQGQLSSQSLGFLVRHIGRIAGTLVRNAATLGGHLALVRSSHLESDLATILVAAGAEVQLTDVEGHSAWMLVEDFAAAGSSSSSSSNGSTSNGVTAATMAQQLGISTIITAVRIPLPVSQPGSSSSTAVWSHKLTSHRYSNEHATLNMCCWMSGPGVGLAAATAAAAAEGRHYAGANAPVHGISSNGNSSSSSGGDGSAFQLRVAVGTYQPSSSSDSDSNDVQAAVWRCSRAVHVEAALLAALNSKQLQRQGAVLDVLRRLPELLLRDVEPAGRLGAYVRSAAPGLLLKGLSVLLPQQQQQQQQQQVAASSAAQPVSWPLLCELREAAVADLATAAVPCGAQDLPVDTEAAPPLYTPTEKDGGRLQASGEAEYTDDVPNTANGLYAAYVTSSRAAAKLLQLDWRPALQVTGVVGFIGPEDIPAGPATAVLDKCMTGPPEPLFAYDTVEYVGQPLGLIVAKTLSAARQGAARVQVAYGPMGCRQAATAEASTKAAGESEGSSSDGSRMQEDGAAGGGGGGGPLASLPAAVAANSWYDLSMAAPMVTASRGDVAAALASSSRQLSGQVKIGSQRHVYMEPQTAVAAPEEGGRLSVISSCQGVDQVLWAVSKLLKLRHNQVHVSCRRVGGGFGGKADRALYPAAAAAVAAHKLRRQVRLVVSATVDGSMNAGRCPMVVDWTAGVDAEGQLQGLTMDITCVGGAYFGAMMVEVFSICSSIDNVYDIPAMSASVKLARCHLPPRTSMRGPGKVSAVIIIEQILQQLANTLGQNPTHFREKLMIQLPEEAKAAAVAAAAAAAGQAGPDSCTAEAAAGNSAAVAVSCSEAVGDGVWPHPKYLPEVLASGKTLATSFGKPIAPRQYTLPYMWQQLQAVAGYEQLRRAVDAFNLTHRLKKRGLALVPIRYQLYHATRIATVTIYADGSVLVMHPGTEMGQGIATKVKQAAAHALGLLLPCPQQRALLLPYIRVATGCTELMPHGGVAAASTTSEAATAAVTLACEELVERMRPAAETLAAAAAVAHGGNAAGGAGASKPASAEAAAAGGGGDGDGRVVTWEQIVKAVGPLDPVMASKVLLTASARGGLSHANSFPDPTAIYHSFGVGLCEVEVDCVTGERLVRRADLMFDAGRTINPAVDLGQVEGAFMQGVGHVLSEEVVEDEVTGAALTPSTWTYKPPGVAELPAVFNVHMLRDSPLHIAKLQHLGAKATGEPPMMLAAAVACALQDAVAAAWEDYNLQQQQQVVSADGGVGVSNSYSSQQHTLELPATTANMKDALPPVLFGRVAQ